MTIRKTLLVAGAALLAASGLYAAKSRLAPPPGLTATALARNDAPRRVGDGILLPSGWVLHPAGRQIPIADMALNMALSPDGRRLLVSTGGFRPCQLLSLDTRNEQLQYTQTLDEAWEGMAFAPTGDTLYVSGGGRGLLWRFRYAADGGEPVRQDPLPVADLVGRPAPYSAAKVKSANAWIAGVAAAADGTLYALNNQGDTLYALDPATGQARASARTGDHPNAVALSPDGRTVWVTNQGGGSVSVFQAGTLAPLATIPVGVQPVALRFSPDGKALYVANSGGNTVSVLDPATQAVTQTIRTSLFPQAPVGSTPNALALAPDGKTLYVTNADNNDMAVIDVSDPAEARVRGFIPTGWYPTAVAVSPDGKKLFVGVGKGDGTGPSFPRRGGGMGLSLYNVPGQSYGPRHDTPQTFDYVSSLVHGDIAVIDTPTPAQLARYTAQVIAGCPYRDQYLTHTAERPAHTVIPTVVGQKSPITHVLYIIKENRTYDQVFGDLGIGDGDPDLTLFGKVVTPNHHALAREWVTLDNLYCNGEVSEDGHQWCNAAFCTDWTEKVYPANYATPSRGDAPGDEAVTASPGGYLWDDCARHGLTYRTYGENAGFTSSAESAPVATSPSPGLRGHVSLAWELAPRQGKGRDFQRVDVFLDDLRQAEASGDWPDYMVMSLGEDHTVGTTPNRPTPWAAVASNDLALGKVVQAVSHSPFWPHTAIFVIEDDAQAGPDHVDAHRTVGLVISPYVKRHALDHMLYTTASFVRTMELLLGLTPMSQYDAGAAPLFNSFTGTPDLAPFTALAPRTDLMALNPPGGYGALASSRLDFSHYDECDPDTLNRLLWHAVKGPRSPYPGPTYGTRLAAR